MKWAVYGLNSERHYAIELVGTFRWHWLARLVKRLHTLVEGEAWIAEIDPPIPVARTN